MKNTLYFLLAAFLLGFSPCTHAQIITTVVGDSLGAGYNGDNIPATIAALRQPTGVTVDAVGNIYIADRYNYRVRKVNTSGIITTIAGTGMPGFSGDGSLATAAELNYPYGIAVDTIGNIYFSDDLNVRVRKIDTYGIITTIAGNGTAGYNGDNIPATSAELNGIGGLVIDKYGNVYVADFDNNRVRKINTSGIITTIAGIGTCGNSGIGGLATAAELCEPNGVVFDGIGNLYIVEYSGNRVRKVDTAGIITTIAGTDTAGYNGDNIVATSAELDQPLGVAVDGSGNVYISDADNNRIRKVSNDGIITTIAGIGGAGGYSGDNGPATLAEIAYPIGIAVDHSGSIFFADEVNDRIRRVGWPESVNELSAPAQTIIIYPNPSRGVFTINISSNIQEQVQLTITNTLGEQVKKLKIITNTPIAIQLDQPSGTYYLSAISSHNIINKIINVVK